MTPRLRSRQARRVPSARARDAAYATLAYAVITVVMTWPLVGRLTRDVAWDLGDSVLNMWILAWDCEQLRGILHAHFSHFRHFFDANIFHPAPLTLAYSEHLIPQAIQIFPIYVVTKNPILCYNLLFLSTFVLSGLGMFLFAREVTASTAAGFIGGLLFAFAPYRIPQSSHLQVLSAQWMPFALYGFRRYLDGRRVRALIGGTTAAIVQGLSCGYYLLYFSPFAIAYALWEMWRNGRLSDRRTWIALVAAATIAAVVVTPFVMPYLRVSRELQLSRSLPETTRLSADVYSYATASAAERFWGKRIADVFPKSEGELFPGLIPVVLAIVGIVVMLRTHHGYPQPVGGSRYRPAAARVLWLVALIHALAAVVTIVFRRLTFDLWLFNVRLADVTQLLLRGTVAYASALYLSPSIRARAAAFMRSGGVFVILLLLAMWLSLGPSPQVLGRPLDLASPYRYLWTHVPGFEGLRVPARFAMIAALMLAVLGAVGAAAIAQVRYGLAMLVLSAAFFLWEAAAEPFVLNGMSPVRDFVTPAARLELPRRPPPVYNAVGQLPPDVVLADLPLGQADYDLRAMYYSIDRWRPIVNGYSGFFPPHYGQVKVALSEVPRHAEDSVEVLRELGVTHIVVHEAAYLTAEGRDTTSALRRLGASEVFRDGGDVLLTVPRSIP